MLGKQWKPLKITSHMESLTNKVFLKKSLFKIQQHDKLSCLDSTSQIMEISHQLALMNFQIQPLDLVIILLAALHPRYHVWVEQIEKLDEDQLTWGIITKKLYREESRISRINERVEARVLIPVIPYDHGSRCQEEEKVQS